jgi:hypothetical protein
MHKVELLAPNHCSSFLNASKIEDQSAHIGEQYDVSAKTIRDIWNHRTWTFAIRHLWHITDQSKTYWKVFAIYWEETLLFWKIGKMFPNFGIFLELFGNFEKLWETLGTLFGRYTSLGGDRDWAPARYISHGARTMKLTFTELGYNVFA